MKFQIIILVLILTLFSANAKSFQSCYDNAVSNAALNMCASKEYHYWDKKLNYIYRKVMRVLPHSEKRKLKIAERHWIKYRDSECESEGYAMRGGTGEVTIILGCKIDLTKERIHQLKAMLY